MEVNTSIKKISEENDINEIYQITFPSGKEITTKVTPTMRQDLEGFGIMATAATDEEKQTMLEGYLIRAAQNFIDLGLDKAKQINGKIDTEIGGIEDVF